MSEFRRRLMMAAGEKELPNYLCFTALESGTFTFRIGSDISVGNYSYIEYSIDECRTWTKVSNTNKVEVTATTPTLNVGDKVYWRGSGVRLNPYVDARRTCSFSSSGMFNASGELLSILQLGIINPTYSAIEREFYKLFYGTKIVDAADMLISTAIAVNNCCFEMFRECTLMTYPPKILATQATGTSCYNNMFYGCTSLLESIEINISSLSNSCCRGMFNGCTNLVMAKPIHSTSAAQRSLQSMFESCTSLKTAPIIYIEEFTNTHSMDYMFNGCTSLETIPILPAQILLDNSYYQLCLNCSKLSYVKMLAIDISASNATFRWMQNVQTNSGIFVKHIDAQWTDTGTSGVPTNWTVIYYVPALDKYYLDQQRQTECDDHGNPI